MKMLGKTIDDVSILLHDIIKIRVKMTSENIGSNKNNGKNVSVRVGVVPKGKIQLSVRKNFGANRVSLCVQRRFDALNKSVFYSQTL